MEIITGLGKFRNIGTGVEAAHPLPKAEGTGDSPNHAAFGGLVALGLGPAPFK